MMFVMMLIMIMTITMINDDVDFYNDDDHHDRVMMTIVG